MQKEALEEKRKELKQVLTSKLEEFELLGYKNINEDELWEYFVKKKWKKRDEIMFHEMVNDILTLSPQKYLTYVTIEFMKM